MASILGRDVAVIAKSSITSRMYYFQVEESHVEELARSLEEVIEAWNTMLRGTIADDPIVVELRENDHSGDYRALAPKPR
jgi:hypothetical protein